MQKHWKMMVALLLALMMLMSSVGMAESGMNSLSGSGNGADDRIPSTQETVTPGATEDPSAGTNGDDVQEPAATSTPEAPAEATDAAETPVSTETPAPTVTVVPPVQPEPEASQEPADESENGTAEIPPAEGEVTDAPEADLEGDVSINPEEAETAPTPVPTQAPPERPLGRETWVVMNTSMKDVKLPENLNALASIEDKDAPAAMSNLLAKFLLARAVADNAPVGVFMMRDVGKNGSEVVSTPAEWDDLLKQLSSASFSAGDKHPTQHFQDFMTSIKDKTMKDVDVIVLATNAHTTANQNGSSIISDVLNKSGVSMHYINFQKAADEDKPWVYQKVQTLNVENFDVYPFVYPDALKDPIATAMDVFELNLLAPLTTITLNEEGVCTWNHKGMDTLLVIDTDQQGVKVTAGVDVEAGGAFPVVIPVSQEQCMVLLRGANPGTYLIEGQVKGLTVAYAIDPAVAKPVVQETRTEGEPWVWYLEDQTLRVSVNLPQVRPGDLGKSVCIVMEQAAAAEPELMDEIMPGLSSDEEITEEETTDEETTEPAAEATQEQVEDEYTFVTVSQDRITEISSDENGHVWEIVIPRQELGKGKICFEFNVKGFVIQSDVYEFEVVDRQLAYKERNAADLNYYYNVPGQEDAPISEELANYFYNPDQQLLNYTPVFKTTEYTIEDGTFHYFRGENTQDKQWFLEVDDGESNPIEFSVAVEMVDFMAAVAQWKANIDTVDYQVTLGEETEIAFVLPAEYVAFYQDVREQYPELPETLAEALKVTAVLTDDSYPSGWPLEVVFIQQEDGSLTGKVVVPAYTEQEDLATVTFYVDILGTEIADQTIVNTCTITVPNDKPALANAALKELKFKVGIHGAPDAREPLTFAAINGEMKEDAVRLPDPFVPAQLFVDLIHLEGSMTVIIEVDQPELVQLVPVDETMDDFETQNSAGIWVLNQAYSEKAYVLKILDEGTVNVIISATDGECNGEESINWTFQVHSVYDLILLIMIISASVLTVLIIVLLVLRQIRKPSFARNHSVMHMRMCTQYSPNGADAWVPMDVYGKKETDLAKLFIACQQTPVTSLPMDVLADVAIQPGKRRSYRIVLGKRAEHLNIAVANMAQPTNKPVPFEEDQTVNVYADGNEVIFFMISSGS